MTPTRTEQRGRTRGSRGARRPRRGLDDALALAVAGDLEGALRIGRELLNLAPEDPGDRMALFRLLIEWARAASRPMECKRLATRAVEWGTSELGPLAEPVLVARSSELYWMCEVGYDALAERRFPSLVADVEKGLGPESELAWAVRMNSAMPLKARGDFAGAVEIYRDLVVDMARSLDEDDVLLLTARDNFAEVLLLDGEYEEARVVYEQILARVERLWGRSDRRALRVRSELAKTAFAMGDEAGAVEEWASIARVCEESLGRHHPRTVATLSLLMAASLESGDPGRCARIARRLIADPPPDFDETDLEGFELLARECERRGREEGGSEE